jgi:hypothetical protein
MLKHLTLTVLLLVTNLFNLILHMYISRSKGKTQMWSLPQTIKPSNLVQHYRTISLLLRLGKVLETVILKRLKTYVEDKFIFPDR